MSHQLSTAAPDTALPMLRQAKALLAQAKDVGDVLELRHQATAMEMYLRRREASSEAHADAWEILQHANRRIGELTRVIEHGVRGPRVQGRSLREGKTRALAEHGLSSQIASRCEQLAQLSATDFEQRVALGRARIIRKSEGPVVAAPSWSPDYDRASMTFGAEFLRKAREVVGDGRLLQLIRSDGQQVKEFIRAFEAQQFVAGVVLCARPSIQATWFQLLAQKFDMCLPDAQRRIDGDKVGQREAIAVFYAGPSPARFAQLFSPIGVVLRAVGRSA